MDEFGDLVWTEPTQSRSREKVERILNATVELADQAGSLDLKMTEIAKTAGVSVGTLYQFFPHRSALIARLFSRKMAVIDASFEALFAPPSKPESMAQDVEALLHQQLAYVRSNKGLSVIWSASSLHPDIERADFANTKRNATVLRQRIEETIGVPAEPQALYTTCLLICHLWSGVIRLCLLSSGDDVPQIIAQYAQMIVAHCQSILEA